MDELIKLLQTITAYVTSLHQTYIRLVDIMSEEEDLVARYEMSNLQNIVAEKDQAVQRAQKIEEKRAATLKRICFLIAYDARNTLPNISDFNIAFSAYLKNVETLIDLETHNALDAAFLEYRDAAGMMQADFATNIAPRIRQNKAIMEKVRANFQKSIRLFESIGGVAHSYNKKGQANSEISTTPKNTMLRVQV